MNSTWSCVPFATVSSMLEAKFSRAFWQAGSTYHKNESHPYPSIVQKQKWAENKVAISYVSHAQLFLVYSVATQQNGNEVPEAILDACILHVSVYMNLIFSVYEHKGYYYKKYHSHTHNHLRFCLECPWTVFTGGSNDTLRRVHVFCCVIARYVTASFKFCYNGYILLYICCTHVMILSKSILLVKMSRDLFSHTVIMSQIGPSSRAHFRSKYQITEKTSA